MEVEEEEASVSRFPLISPPNEHHLPAGGIHGRRKFVQRTDDCLQYLL